MNFKKIFVLIICIIIQVTCVVSAEEDATQSVGYQNVMQEVRQRNAGIQPITTQPVTPLATPVTMPVPTPIPTTRTPQGLIVPNSIVIPPIHPTQHPTITMHTYTTERQNMYGEIVESYNKLSKDKDNKNLCANYINSVENYLNKYGDILLKSENRDNYFQIMQRLGFAYKNTSRIDDAIDTYENLLEKYPLDINIKKQLLNLYDMTKSCNNVENVLSQIKKHEPNYNTDLINCSTNKTSLYTTEDNTTTGSSSNSDIGDFLWWYLAAIAAYFAIKAFIDSFKLHERTTSNNPNQTSYNYQDNSGINNRQEYEEKTYIQQEYKRKQIENEQREQERKRIEAEKQKRDALIKSQRLQEKYWYNLKPREFEEKIGQLFKDLGYKVKVTPASNDGGIDLFVWQGNKKYVVQCKHYKKNKVGPEPVRALLGLKEYHKADGAIFVALSGVSKSGYILIKNTPNYELWTIKTIIAKAKEVNYNYMNQ